MSLDLFHKVNRIKQAKISIEDGLRYGDPTKVQKGAETISLLVGGVLLELSKRKGDSLYTDTLSMLLSSYDLVQQAQNNNLLPTFTVNVNKPSEWISFDGDIKPPLDIRESSIKNAGNGLFTTVRIHKGTCIAPIRVKLDNTGNFFDDWAKFPVASLLNHSPIANTVIVRDNAPLGAKESFGETCYLVANRDIDVGEEITSNYKDKGWAEWDYYTELDLPFDQWDQNVLGYVPEKVKHSPEMYTNTVCSLGGSSLVYASTKTNSIYSDIMALGGLALLSYPFLKR